MLSASDAKAVAYFDERYDIIFDQPLVLPQPFYISDTKEGDVRTCRFCRRAVPEVTFNSRAHTVPESMGNKSLLSKNECDECNQFFAQQYDDHLSKRFMLMRATSQIRGKNGVPTYKDKEGKIRIEMGGEGPGITIESEDLFAKFKKDGPHAFKLPVPTPSQPYVPVRAAMALIKAACSLVPASELEQVRTTIDWLMGNVGATVSYFPILHTFVPGPNPYRDGKVMLLRRKVDEPIPYLWCILATGNVQLQFFVPFCEGDTWLNNGSTSTTTLMRFPTPFADDWEYGQVTKGIYDWSGVDQEVANDEATLNVNKAELVETIEGGDDASNDSGSTA